MTPEERKAAAEVMVSDGPWEGQRFPGGSVWVAMDNPNWDWKNWRYRVKPKPIVRYVNLYPSEMGSGVYCTRADADNRAGSKRIACIRIEFTEGQFDE